MYPVPDRFDLSGPAELDSSLGLVTSYCTLAGPQSVSAQQHHQLLVATLWVRRIAVLVGHWLDGELVGLDPLIDRPPEDVDASVDVATALADLRALTDRVRPDVVRLAHRRDTRVLPSVGATVMALDLARHVVRIACVATIDRGWPWPLTGTSLD